MSVHQHTVRANPIQHLRYNASYRDNYKPMVDATGRSWEVRLVRWAESGNAFSKICRWALVFFSVAPAFAALHDKIKVTEPEKIMPAVLSKTALDLQKIFNASKAATLSPAAQKIVNEYEIEDSNDLTDEDTVYHACDVAIVGDEAANTPCISDARSASLFATINKQDYSDLKPIAEKQIKEKFDLATVQLQSKGSMQISTPDDAHGNEYLKCSKTFQIVGEDERDYGTVTIERNFNPAAEDTVTFTYKVFDYDGELP